MKSIEKWLQKLINPENLAIFLTAVYCLSLLPVLLIAKYNYPSADDYSNGLRCYQAWHTTHSFLAVLKEAIGRTIFEYTQWRGCFTSSFLSALPPSIWGERWYGLTTLIIVVSLTASVLYFLSCLLKKVFQADNYSHLAISMLLLIMLVQCIRPGARTELLYWYSGAINYAFIFSLELFFLGIMISLACNREKRKIPQIILSSILGFVVGGGNQMSTLNALIIIATAIFFITILKKWKEYRTLIIPMGFCILGAVLSFAAPGNFVRAQSSNMMPPVKAIFVSFYYCLELSVTEWISWPVIFMIAMMVPLFWNIAKKIDFKFPCPILAVIYGYCITSAMFTPSLFALGNIGAGRIQGLTYWMFLLMLTLCTFYVTGWTVKKFQKYHDPADISFHKFSLDFSWYLASCIGFLGFAFFITIIPEPHYYTATSAATDIMNGTAEGYANECETRIEIYRNVTGEDIWVSPLKNYPELLFFNDITENKEDWINLAVARYYDLGSVSLQKRNMQ